MIWSFLNIVAAQLLMVVCFFMLSHMHPKRTDPYVFGSVIVMTVWSVCYIMGFVSDKFEWVLPASMIVFLLANRRKNVHPLHRPEG